MPEETRSDIEKARDAKTEAERQRAERKQREEAAMAKEAEQAAKAAEQEEKKREAERKKREAENKARRELAMQLFPSSDWKLIHQALGLLKEDYAKMSKKFDHMGDIKLLNHSTSVEGAVTTLKVRITGIIGGVKREEAAQKEAKTQKKPRTRVKKPKGEKK